MYKQLLSAFTKAPILLAAILLAIIIPLLSLPEITKADMNNTRADVWGTPEYPGTSWLSNNGVEVYSNGPQVGAWDNTNKTYDGKNATINSVNGISSGTEWQCVELVNRLYFSMGWTTKTWVGNGDTLINAVPNGFTTERNDSISYLNPGDVITFTDATFGTKNDDGGHTAIINSVGSSIQIVSQNTVYVLLNATISSGSLANGNAHLDIHTALPGYTVQGIIHNPGTTPPPVISTLKTIATSDGHIQTFKITNGTLSENWYNWGAGSNRYGIWTQPVGMPSTPIGAPAIVQRTGQNKIDVFVRGSNNQIYETWYDYQYGTWGGWINMGGNVTSDPQTIDTSDAHEQVFGTGSNLVQQNWFNPNVSVNNFSGWTTSHGLPANAVGSPAVALRSGQTAIDEFVRGGDNQIYETWYDISNSNWGGWKAMGGYVTSDPQVTTTSDGHDQVFGTGSNLVKQSWYYVNGDVGGWTTSAGLPSVTTTSSPASVLRTGQGRIDEFITGSNNQVYQTWYDSGVGNWGPWFNMGGTTTSDPQGIATSDGHDQIFGTNNSAVAQNWFDRVTGYIGGWITF
jgi:hypothetical protein